MKLSLNLGDRWFSYNMAYLVGRGADILWQMTTEQLKEALKTETRLAVHYARIVTYYHEQKFKELANAGCGSGHKSFKMDPA